MSQTSTHLSLPYIQGGQAQKHVTHNEALRTLDALVHLSILSETVEPPVDAQDGDRYVVAAGAIGVFAGQDNNLAMLDAGTWTFHIPKPGWSAFNRSTGGMVAFDGSVWTSLSGQNANTPLLGVNASADETNRFVVASDAVLFTHDSGGHQQIKVNKGATPDTASVLFQTSFSGRAEMGLAGNDNFAIKVSGDGTSFVTAIDVDGTSGAVSFPATELSDPAFGNSTLVTERYADARGSGLVANATCALGNSYNYPATTTFDPAQSPGLAGTVCKSGHFSGQDEMVEKIAVDPNRAYRLGAYLRQESASGDWSGHANGDRHIQHIGLQCFDADGLAINAPHHMRYRHGGLDSLTTLAQPLAPGDTTVHLDDAAGWNESDGGAEHRGVVIFEYKDARGQAHSHYSRIEEADLFELGNVDKTAGIVTLNKAFPAHLGNPDDAGGVWPVGTRIANRSSDWSVKFSLCDEFVPDASDTWYHLGNSVGGTDLSGTNSKRNFAPGTVSVRPVWLVNYSNRSGGWYGYPDTGTAQKVWIGGVSLDLDGLASLERTALGDCNVHRLEFDPSAGSVNVTGATLQTRVID